MSLESRDQPRPDESELEVQKKSKLLYSVEFLLSLRALDVCQKLPSGFDTSILSEFEDAFNDANERHITSGGLPFRRNDYGSAPQHKTEGSGDFSRGSSSRWEHRSPASNSRDGESDQGDAGRRFGNQARRSWQPAGGHDGLLGSGAFPRPPGYVGPAAPKAKATGQFQLSRTSEPYQPPRPYKAPPFQRKEHTDSRNDETFGSDERLSDDRTEEERKRRASFELLRKEQQKQLHERQKPIPDNDVEKSDADIMTLLEKSDKNEKMQKHENVENNTALFQNDNARSSTVAQSPVYRPLVPPGFASADKGLSVQSSSPYLLAEVKLANVDSLTLDAISNDQEKSNQFAASFSGPKISVLSDENTKFGIKTSGFEVLTHVAENVDHKFAVHHEVLKENNDNDALSKREERSDVTVSLADDNSTSLLEKLFSSAQPKLNGSSPAYVKNEVLNMNEGAWSTAPSESSKFAQWFCEEEKKPGDDFSSKNLLSLIVNSDKALPPTLDIPSEKAIEHIILTLNSEINATAHNFHAPPSGSLMYGIPETHPQADKPDSSAATVLTCEDLEQFILADVNDGNSGLERPIQGTWTAPDRKSEEQQANIDDHASQHILSLLQKGTTKNDKAILPTSMKSDIGPFAKFAAVDVSNSQDHANNIPSLGTGRASHDISEVSSLQKNLTLEALFGAAFMNELQSAEAPVSAKKVSDGISSSSMPQYGASSSDMPQSHVASFQHADSARPPSISLNHLLDIPTYEGNTGNLDHRKDSSAPYILGPETENGSTVAGGSKLVGGFEVGALDVQLPEEDSLIILNDHPNSVPLQSFPFPDASKSKNFLTEKTGGQLPDELVNSVPRDADQQPGLDGPRPFHSLHDRVDPDSLINHLQGITPQLTHLRNEPRVPLPELDHHTNRNQQMMFTSPEAIHQDPHLKFPPNLAPPSAFNHVGGPHYELSAHNLMLPRMPIPGNFPPQFPVQGLPGGIPGSHPINQINGFIPQLSNMHNIQMHHQQMNYGGVGMGLPGPINGGGSNINHPEAFQRLIDMELRAKQVHPAVAGGHFPGIYSSHLEQNLHHR